MKMYARLRYLYEEGFEVASLLVYDDASGEGNAKIIFVQRDEGGVAHLHSEVFDVAPEEMTACSALFLEHLTRAEE